VRHLVHSLAGAGFFFFAILAVIQLTDVGVRSSDSFMGVFENGYLTKIISGVTWLGAFAGFLSSLVFRKSANQRLYVTITLVLTMAFVSAIIWTL